MDASRFGPHGGAIPGHDVVGRVTEVHAQQRDPPPAIRLGDGDASGASEVEPNTPEQEKTTGDTSPKFKDGDFVWGLLDFDRDGAASTFTWAYEHELALLPSLPQSSGTEDTSPSLAAIPLSGLTAYQCLFVSPSPFPASDLNQGVYQGKTHRVLISGSSGSVGVMAVQIAKAAGYWVIATASAHNQRFVNEELGADEVVDYTAHGTLAEKMQERGMEEVDLVVETVGGEALVQACAKGVVRDGGAVVCVAHPLEALGERRREEVEVGLARRGVRFRFFVVEPDGRALGLLGSLVEKGRLRGYVADVWHLSGGREAMEVVEKGRVKGKVVLEVTSKTA